MSRPQIPGGSKKPTREAESLLEQLAESAIDNAYYEVDRQNEPKPLIRVITLFWLVFLGFFIVVVALQSQNDRPATEVERQALIDSIAGRQETVESRRMNIEALQAQISALTDQNAPLTKSAQRDKLNAAAEAVAGDGIEIRLSSAAGDTAGGVVSDLDVQLVVNGLWMSGAEAVDVGGSRLSATSAIRSAGEGITVNFESISEPIVIRAIGSPRTLVRQFGMSPSGRYLDDRAQYAGISWDLDEVEEIRMNPAPKQRLEVRHASVLKRGGS